MWELFHKEGWAPKNWCLQIVVLEKTLESPLDCKEIKPINLKGNKFCHCVHCFPIYLPRSDGTECHDLCLWNIEFSASFFILLFFLYQEAFHTSSVSAIRVVSFANLRLFIFLPESLIPASSSTAFCMMYSAYKLNKQGDNIQPWHTPFPIWF